MVPRLPPPERCGFSVDDRGIDDGAEHDKVLEPWIPTSSDKWTMPTEERLPDDGETDTGGTTSSNHRHRSQGDSSIGSCSRISGTSPGDHDAQGQSSANFTPSGSHAHLHNQHLFSSQRPRTPSSYSRAPPERSSGECLNSPSSCAEGGHRNDAPSPRLGVSPARFKNSGLGSPVVSSPRSESPGTRGGGGNDGIVFSPRKLGRRSSDSQMQARRNGDSLGGVSHNFKVQRGAIGGAFESVGLLACSGRKRKEIWCCDGSPFSALHDPLGVQYRSVGSRVPIRWEYSTC